MLLRPACKQDVPKEGAHTSREREVVGLNQRPSALDGSRASV